MSNLSTEYIRACIDHARNEGYDETAEKAEQELALLLSHLKSSVRVREIEERLSLDCHELDPDYDLDIGTIYPVSEKFWTEYPELKGYDRICAYSNPDTDQDYLIPDPILRWAQERIGQLRAETCQRALLKLKK